MSFVDRNGRKWNTAVTVGSIRRVKQLTDIDLAQIFDEKVYSRLVNDPFALVDVIVALLKPQMDETGTTEEAFIDLFDGDTIEKATESLITSIAEFFPAPKRAPLLRVWERTQANQTKMASLTIEKIDALMDQQEGEMLEKLNSIDPLTFGKSSGDTPALPE